MNLETISAVNVIDIHNNAVHRVVSFPDTVQGNKQAEFFFSQRVKELQKDISDEDLNACIEDGIFEGIFDNEGYSVNITHSSRLSKFEN